MSKDPQIFLNHIIESINNIENFIQNINKEKFNLDIKLQDAVIRRIEIIGEAVKNLPKSFTEEYSEIPWIKIAGMRDKLMHHYFGVDMNLVWKTIKEDIPLLKDQILKIKQELK
jgi:uncharacterized protein with HEPN domain